MKPEFTASCVTVEELEQGIGIWMADTDPVARDYLTLQREMAPDEQSISSGLDRVYIERNDQGYSCYGGIEKVSLFRDQLCLRLDVKGEKSMGGLSYMKVIFDLDAEALHSLREGLAVCFHGFEGYRDEVEV